MAKRKALSKSVRFEVFKRDSFTCQYCGEKAPDVVLVVDHIHPVAKGGANEIINLITSCVACNSGKSDRALSDDSAVKRQQRQLEELQNRREQLDLLLTWKRELVEMDDRATDELAAMWTKLVPGWGLNSIGMNDLKKAIRKHGAATVADAMRQAASQYIQIDPKTQSPTHESVDKAWGYVARIAGFQKVLAEKPYMRDVLYIKGILRRRFRYVCEWQAKALLEEAFVLGVHVDDLKRIAKELRNWTEWEEVMSRWIAEERGENGKALQ